MAPRKAKGETPEATKALLDAKYGNWVATALSNGQNPHVLADQINNDASPEQMKEVEKRDKAGKVTGMDEVTVGPLQVTADQLQEFYPESYRLGEPDGGP